MDLKVAQQLVQVSIERVAQGQFDGLMDDVLKHFFAEPPFEELAKNPLQVRFELYQALWNETLKVLWATYLPDSGESPELWNYPEVTLQTVLLCRLTPPSEHPQ